MMVASVSACVSRREGVHSSQDPWRCTKAFAACVRGMVVRGATTYLLHDASLAL